MKRNLLFVLLISVLLTSCNQNEQIIYSAPTNVQITDYIYSNSLDIQDSVWIKDAAIILLENSLITLYTDEHEKVYDHKLSWGSNATEPVIVGNGVPYVAIILNDKLLSLGAERILITYTNGKPYLRGITKKKGYLISNTESNEIDNIIIFDKDCNELYKKR